MRVLKSHKISVFLFSLIKHLPITSLKLEFELSENSNSLACPFTRDLFGGRTPVIEVVVVIVVVVIASVVEFSILLPVIVSLAGLLRSCS